MTVLPSSERQLHIPRRAIMMLIQPKSISAVPLWRIYSPIRDPSNLVSLITQTKKKKALLITLPDFSIESSTSQREATTARQFGDG